MTRDLFGLRRVHLLNASIDRQRNRQCCWRCVVRCKSLGNCSKVRKNAFVTLGYVGSRLVYEIAVYEFKNGTRETPDHCRSVASRAFFSPQWNLPMMFRMSQDV